MTDFRQLLNLQPNRPPFLFIDKVIYADYKQQACTQKFLSNEEWFFQCHWEGDPNMPGMLQLEAMSQTASLCLFSAPEPPSKLYLATINKAIFRRKLVPGDAFQTKANLLSNVRNIYKFKCRVETIEDQKLISKSEVDLVWPNEKLSSINI